MALMQWEGNPPAVNGMIGSLGSRSQSFECSRWSTPSVKGGDKYARLSLCAAEHSAFTYSQMPAHELRNHGGIENAKPRYYLFTGNRPARVIWENGSKISLPADEMILLRSDMPMAFDFRHDFQSRVLIFDTELLVTACPSYAGMIGHRLALSPELERVVRQIFGAISDSFETDLFEAVGDGLCHSMLSVLRYAKPVSPDQPGDPMPANLTDLRRRELRNFIERRLGDPELNLAMMARHFGLSPRYIQQLFAAVDTTPTGYIEQTRLKSAAMMIRREQDRTITEIAFACGFNSSAYFSTRFRHSFGETPRAYRHHGSDK